MDLLNKVGDAVSGAADAVADTVSAGVDGAVTKVAEEKIKEHTGCSITVELEDIPDEYKGWVRGTGLNSLCVEYTWRFLQDEQKKKFWEQRGIDKIVMSVKTDVDDDDRWIGLMPEWESGSSTLKLVWYPRGLRWGDDTTWVSPSYKRWWLIGDEIVFGLQLYQIPGKCFYKSDWLSDFEDVDPNGCLPTATMKCKRWFQFRHWIIFWYPNAMWGYNWAYTKEPPKLPDGSDFNLDSVLQCPSLPDLKMPEVKLPSLPDIEMPSVDMPSVDLPSIEAPSLSAPSLSAPSLSAPSIDLSSPPSMPARQERPKGRWAAHGFIELTDLKVKADGKQVIFSNANVTNFWLKDGHIDTEKKEHQRMVLETTSSEQAESWAESLKESGVEEGDMGGCCTVA